MRTRQVTGGSTLRPAHVRQQTRRACVCFQHEGSGRLVCARQSQSERSGGGRRAEVRVARKACDGVRAGHVGLPQRRSPTKAPHKSWTKVECPGEHLEEPSHGALGTRTTSRYHHLHSSLKLQFPLERLNSKPTAVTLEVAIHLHTTHNTPHITMAKTAKLKKKRTQPPSTHTYIFF